MNGRCSYPGRKPREKGYAGRLPGGETPHPHRAITRSLKIHVLNLTRNVTLADAAEAADTSQKRRTGLLKHTSLAPGKGLWIVPCESVHSFFMKFTIDVLYLDRKNRVKKIRPEMAPWRISGCLTAHSVLELPAGTIVRTGTERGDQLRIKTLG
jgi:uncharacterized membrane protein (UPF0127 family)